MKAVGGPRHQRRRRRPRRRGDQGRTGRRVHLFVNPIVVGGGTPSLPDGVRLELELLDERRFANGVVYLRYRTSD